MPPLQSRGLRRHSRARLRKRGSEASGRRHEMPPLQRRGPRRHSRARLRKRGSEADGRRHEMPPLQKRGWGRNPAALSVILNEVPVLSLSKERIFRSTTERMEKQIPSFDRPFAKLRAYSGQARDPSLRSGQARNDHVGVLSEMTEENLKTAAPSAFLRGCV